MYCIYKEVLVFAGYILGLKGLVSGSSLIFIMADILGPTWHSRQGYLLILVHIKEQSKRRKKSFEKLNIICNTLIFENSSY
jgi:hypothetical protein